MSPAGISEVCLRSCPGLTFRPLLQDRLMAEQELKDHDSVFREPHGTAVHYKLAQAIDPAHPTAIHCYHGFGANTFSWSYVYKALSDQLHAQVTKHDMPGFGLTQRPTNIDSYSLEFNGRLGRLVMDAELAAAGVLDKSELDSQIGPGVTLQQLQSVHQEHQAGQGEVEPGATVSSIEAAAVRADCPSNTGSGAGGGHHAGTQTKGKLSSAARDDTVSGELEYRSGNDQRPASGGGERRVSRSPTSSSASWESVSSQDSTEQVNTGVFSSTAAQDGIKRVLVGHSLGATCAAAEVINHSKVRRHFKKCLCNLE